MGKSSIDAEDISKLIADLELEDDPLDLPSGPSWKNEHNAMTYTFPDQQKAAFFGLPTLGSIPTRKFSSNYWELRDGDGNMIALFETYERLILYRRLKRILDQLVIKTT